jgi:large subunit ribosomal protein L15
MNLEKIQSFINDKKINPTETINITILKKLKLINKNSQKLKILGSGEIKDKINIEADLASKSAIEKLEKISGSIQLKK